MSFNLSMLYLVVFIVIIILPKLLGTYAASVTPIIDAVSITVIIDISIKVHRSLIG